MRPMEKLAELFIAFLDVVKADLAQSKKGIFDVGLSLCLTLAATVFLVAAVALTSYALYTGLTDLVGRELTALFTGLFYAVCGGVCIWIAKRKTTS